MDNLPDLLTPSNSENFKNLYKEYYTKQLRKSIFLNIINNDETDYFDIDIWIKNSNFNKKLVQFEDILNPILEELTKLKWYYTFSYGNTVLFFHKTESPPKNCYNNEY